MLAIIEAYDECSRFDPNLSRHQLLLALAMRTWYSDKWHFVQVDLWSEEEQGHVISNSSLPEEVVSGWLFERESSRVLEIQAAEWLRRTGKGRRNQPIPVRGGKSHLLSTGLNSF
jgi:hypothetical protein